MAVDAFLIFSGAAIAGIPGQKPPVGETQDAAHKGAVEVKEFTFGVENPTTIGSTTAGAGTGRAKFRQFIIKKNVDAASPPLFTACASGAHYDTVTLAVRKAGGTTADYLKYTFKLVYVSSIAWSGSAGDDAPTEDVTFVYGAMQVSYATQTATGALNPPTTQDWSQVLNQPSLNVM